MIDHFAQLDEPRRPWIDPEALKTKFLALSAEVHPDRVHGASDDQKLAANGRYAELNNAYNCLRDTKERLRHLLELEQGVKPNEIERVPPGTMDLFFEVGKVCREVDSFLDEKSKVTSPILKVRLFERGMEWTDRLNVLLQGIGRQYDALLAEIQMLNEDWNSEPVPGTTARPEARTLERLEQVYRDLSFLGRWRAQIRDRIVQLSF